MSSNCIRHKTRARFRALGLQTTVIRDFERNCRNEKRRTVTFFEKNP